MYHCRIFTVKKRTLAGPTIIEGFENLDSATMFAKTFRRKYRGIVVIKKGKRVCRVV